MNIQYRLLCFIVLTGFLVIGCDKATNSVEGTDRENLSSSVSSLHKSTGYAWRNHAAPFDFLFGNHIDTHQQTKLSGKGQLVGFFYIKFTGNVTPEGYPEAEHGNCNQTPDECTVGWILHGIPVRATLLDKPQGQHPTWLIDPDDIPNQQGYSHFHWLGQPDHAHTLMIGEEYDGLLLKLTARETFYFLHHGGFLVTPGLDTLTHSNIVIEN